MTVSWLKSNKGKILLTLLFPPLILYFMWRYAPWQRETKWRVTTALLVFLLFAQTFEFLDERYNPSLYKQSSQSAQIVSNSTTPTVSEQPENSPTPIATPEQKSPTSSPTTQAHKPSTPVPTPQQPIFEIKDKKTNSTVENYMVLINSAKDGENASVEVKKRCSKPCNITIFDNEQALNLQKEYDKMSGSLDTSPSQLTAWKEKHYIFVADHLVGYVTFDTEEYLEYPYKDWYYKELKAKN